MMKQQMTSGVRSEKYNDQRELHRETDFENKKQKSNEWFTENEEK